MPRDSTDVLNAFLRELSEMRVHASHKLGAALKKPLLMLLVLSRIEQGLLTENRIHFAEIRDDLDRLIREYGARPSVGRSGPEQPFYHLHTSSFWKITTERPIPKGQTALVSDLMSPGSFASLRPDVYELLTSNYGARAQAFNAILDRWWPESLHADLRERLNMPDAAAFLPETVAAKRLARDRRFVALVLENYRYSCAMCGFHALINGQATGVDACHIKWHSARGPDTLANGIALCKMHHWAFDRGVVTLSNRFGRPGMMTLMNSRPKSGTRSTTIRRRSQSSTSMPASSRARPSTA